MVIEPSTDADLHQIFAWLEDEATHDRNTFHSNREMIAEGHREGELHVLRDGEDVIAFAHGAPGIINILETRPGMRGRGHGRRLARFCIDRAAEADMAVIEGECAPATSLPFWQAIGFERIPPRYGSSPWVMLRVAKTHVLPEGDPSAVVVRTFDEEAMYRAATAAIGEYRAHAIRDTAGIIHLPERIVLHEASLANGRELVLEIEVDGQVLAREKAKRAKLAAMGVRHDKFRQYYLDRIDPKGDAED